MSDTRLEKIYLEAGRLFNTKGYINTKVSEIAAAAGVATGTMYNLFSGKEAVLSFVIQATLDREWLGQEIGLPMRQSDLGVLQKSLQKVLEEIDTSIMVIKDEEGNLCKDFQALISEIFDMCADYLVAFNNIETNAGVLEELWQEFYPARTRFYKKLEEFLVCYMQAGQIRKLDYLPLHVNNMIETIAWWSVNSHMQMPEITMSRAAAKENCVSILVRAYCV